MTHSATLPGGTWKSRGVSGSSENSRKKGLLHNRINVRNLKRVSDSCKIGLIFGDFIVFTVVFQAKFVQEGNIFWKSYVLRLVLPSFVMLFLELLCLKYRLNCTCLWVRLMHHIGFKKKKKNPCLEFQILLLNIETQIYMFRVFL